MNAIAAMPPTTKRRVRLAMRGYARATDKRLSEKKPFPNRGSFESTPGST